MLYTLLLVALVTIIGCTSVLIATYLILGRGITFKVMLYMMPLIVLFIIDVSAWMLFGGPRSLKASFTLVPLGVAFLTAAFVVVGRSLGRSIASVASDLRAGAEQIDAAAGQVAESSQSLASGA